MLETYKNLLPLVDNRISEEECISTYQDNQSPVAFAGIFVLHFAAMRHISEGYWGITGADKASFCLEELHRALLAYSPNRGAKFLTFLLTCLKNRLRAETQALSYDKRKADYQVTRGWDDVNAVAHCLVDEENCFASAPSVVLVDKKNCFEETELVSAVEADERLSENEKAFCRFFSTNTVHATATDFARRRGISDATVHYIRTALRKKISAVLV